MHQAMSMLLMTITIVYRNSLLLAPSSGNVYVTDRHNNRVQKFSSDGTFITMWGSYGSEDGQFNYPGGVVVDASGNVYVTDYHNNRIQKFSPSPCEVTTPTTSPIPTAISSPTP